MASWSSLIAFSHFGYSAVDEKFTITSRPGNYFWSNGYSWGNVLVTDKQVKISVHFGKLKIKKLVLAERGETNAARPLELKDGEEYSFQL